MEDVVGAEIERAQGQGRRHRGIDRQDRARLVRDARAARDVDHVPGRVEQGFDPDEIGLAGNDGLLERRQILGVVERDLDVAAGGDVAEQLLQTVIHHRRRQNLPARPHGLEHRCGGRLTGSEHAGLFRALELGDQAFHRIVGRALVAAVDVLAHQLVAVVAGECRGKLDRRHDGARARIDVMRHLGEDGVDGRLVVVAHGGSGTEWGGASLAQPAGARHGICRVRPCARSASPRGCRPAPPTPGAG